MTEDATGRTALMIPVLEPSTELVAMNVRPAARNHLLAWDAAQRLVAIHEAGHACAAAALGIPVKVIDITNRHGGSAQIGSPFDDTALPDLAAFDGTMDLSGRGRGLFDAILGPHTEADVQAGLDAAEAWLIASMPVATTA
jgi:hypothetical protein